MGSASVRSSEMENSVSEVHASQHGPSVLRRPANRRLPLAACFTGFCLPSPRKFRHVPHRSARAVRPLAASEPLRRLVERVGRQHVSLVRLLAGSSTAEHTHVMRATQVLRVAIEAARTALRAPNSQWSNPSIERTFQRPLRALWLAAHVER